MNRNRYFILFIDSSSTKKNIYLFIFSFFNQWILNLRKIMTSTVPKKKTMLYGGHYNFEHL